MEQHIVDRLPPHNPPLICSPMCSPVQRYTVCRSTSLRNALEFKKKYATINKTCVRNQAYHRFCSILSQKHVYYFSFTFILVGIKKNEDENNKSTRVC